MKYIHDLFPHRMQVLLLVLGTSSLLSPTNCLSEYHPVEIISQPNVSSDSDGVTSNGTLAVSADGRYVAFQSAATNLVSLDKNESIDIFLVDRTAEPGVKVERISVNSLGQDSNGDSSSPSISADGRYVAFVSEATNIVSNDGNAFSDVFIRDRTEGTTKRISDAFIGGDSNGNSKNPRMTPDGRYVVFESVASNLVLDDNNDASDIFVYDQTNDTIAIVSVDSSSQSGNGPSYKPDISADGLKVVFESEADNLVLNDNNDSSDIFLKNLTDNSTTKLSRSRLNNDTDGPSTAPRISGDGEKVVFLSSATNIVADDKNDLQDAFLLNLTDNSMIRVSENSTGDVDGISQEVLINSTGTYVVFQSSATDLIRNDTNKTSDIFAYTVSSSALSRISVTPLGDELTGASSSPSINSDGHFITFISSDSDLVDLDRNELSDLFLINTQCLLEPEGVTPNDTDGDSTNDCEDGCPVDNTKITPGECGCGTSDEDTDGDETPDCLDSCAEDSSKIAPGGCGCGVPDTDENANGIADCLDPTTSTRPRKPSAVYRKRKNSVRISIPEGYPGYSYQVEIRSTSNVRKRFRTRSQKSLVSANGLSGQLRARYRIILPNGFSQFSRLAKVQKR